MKLNKLVTSVQVACIEHNIDCMVALEYANMWGEVPVIGLNSNFWKLAKQFRKLVETYPSDNFEYFTFPKMALINKYATTVLLNNDFDYVETRLNTLPKGFLIGTDPPSTASYEP